jgi:hypothetical protein
MKTWLVGVALLALGLLPVRAQTDAPRAIVRVGSQTLTTADLEHVKTHLPFERFKTTPAKRRFIDAIYTEFLITRSKLEQIGMVKVTPENVQRRADLLQNAPERKRIEAAGYTLEAFAERELVTRNYLALYANQLATNLWSGVFDAYSQPVVNDPETIAANREREISVRAYTNGATPQYVTLRSMLLENGKQTNAIAGKIRSERDFIALARRYSQVRRDVAGSYTSDFTPSRVSLQELEPEVQLAVLAASKSGLVRVPAPFGRVWLVWLSTPLNGSTNRFQPTDFSDSVSSGPTARLEFRILSIPGTGSDDGLLKKLLNQNPLPVEWLDPSFEGRDPVVARVGGASLRLTEFFTSQLFAAFSLEQIAQSNFFDYSPDSPLGTFINLWLEENAITEGLPHRGAGAEYGLEAYIAARAKVSDVQLKAYYWQHRQDYRYRDDERFISCRFESLNYAKKWRDVVIFAPFNLLSVSLDYPMNAHCDAEGEADPVSLPKFSRATLTPIAGGFVTPVFEYQKGFYFVSGYGFHPDPLLKPFVLVRETVEQTYRRIIAAKQLESFKAGLLQRTGAKNSLVQASAELEQP